MTAYSRRMQSEAEAAWDELGLDGVVKEGDYDGIEYFYTVNSQNVVNAAYVAAKYGDMNILKFCMDNTRRYGFYVTAMREAAENNHIEMAKFLIDNGDTYLDSVIYAVECGHLDMVKFLFSKGADKYNWCLGIAAQHGYIEIAEFLINEMNAKSIVPDFDGAISSAEPHEHQKMLTFLQRERDAFGI